MPDAYELEGHRILVIEDDYYLASDTARALGRAGAEVLGPCPSEVSAYNALNGVTPSAAVVDINLGRGPSFRIARELRARGIPFLFITGYGSEMIPPEFERVVRLQKPVEFRQVVTSLVSALADALASRNHPTATTAST